MSDTIGTALVRAIAPTTAAQVFSVKGAPLPGRIWVKPADGTWTVDYSVDNGVNYQSYTALTGADEYTEAELTTGFTHLKITSSTTDGGTWGIA